MAFSCWKQKVVLGENVPKSTYSIAKCTMQSRLSSIKQQISTAWWLRRTCENCTAWAQNPVLITSCVTLDFITKLQ